MPKSLVGWKGLMPAIPVGWDESGCCCCWVNPVGWLDSVAVDWALKSDEPKPVDCGASVDGVEADWLLKRDAPNPVDWGASEVGWLLLLNRDEPNPVAWGCRAPAPAPELELNRDDPVVVDAAENGLGPAPNAGLAARLAPKLEDGLNGLTLLPPSPVGCGETPSESEPRPSVGGGEAGVAGPGVGVELD